MSINYVIIHTEITQNPFYNNKYGVPSHAMEEKSKNRGFVISSTNPEFIKFISTRFEFETMNTLIQTAFDVRQIC